MNISKSEIVTIEASFSRGNGGLLVQFLDFGIKVIERVAEGPWEVALLQAITAFTHLPRGFRNWDLRRQLEALLGRPLLSRPDDLGLATATSQRTSPSAVAEVDA